MLPNEEGRIDIFEENNIDHPKHYIHENGLETIDVIEAFTQELTGIEAVDIANVIKYISRWKKKNGLEDLKKARWYLEHLIARTEQKIFQNKDCSKYIY